MRTTPQSATLLAANDPVARNALDELLNTLVVMRWDLNDALYDSADTPQAVTNHLKQLRYALDASIAAMKATIQERGLPQEETIDA